jgi:hypothetical protein
MEPVSPPRKFGTGDVVAVKKGVRDPDFDLPIGGWQGTVESFEVGENDTWLYCVAWDSMTLLKARRKVFEHGHHLGKPRTRPLVLPLPCRFRPSCLVGYGHIPFGSETG